MKWATKQPHHTGEQFSFSIQTLYMAFGERLAQNNTATEWRGEGCYADTVMKPLPESSHSKDRNVF